MHKNLLMLQQLGVSGDLIDFMVKNFSDAEFSSLFEGGAFELQFKYNIFYNDEIDIFYNIDKIRSIEKAVNNLISRSEEQDIKILSYYDKGYPQGLRTISKRPLFVYAKGNIDLLNSKKAVACVGTRRPSVQIVQYTHKIVGELVKEDTVIVSGLAKGIDAESHKACLHNHGKTIAVLAHGLDTIYPKENKKLAELILKNEGVLLSEYPLETNIMKNNFVARNRIISALSHGVIIFEAEEKSGTMHTARFAYTQGKSIFCPTPPERELSSGVTKLLGSGSAYPVVSAKEIINHLYNSAGQVEIGHSADNQQLDNPLNEALTEGDGDINKGYSVRLDVQLYERLKAYAAKNNSSVEEIVHASLEKYLKDFS